MIHSLTTLQGIVDVFVTCLHKGDCVPTKGDLGLGWHPLADVHHLYKHASSLPTYLMG